jgi:uncharacterized repeat protein (TIGR03803 family)
MVLISIASNAQNFLFGLTSSGGDGNGTLFKVKTGDTVISAQYNFPNENIGKTPNGGLLFANNGKFYGVTSSGGKNNGVLFEYSEMTGQYNKVYDFIDSLGSAPLGSLIQATNGKIYGVTTFGGANNYGGIFEYDLLNNKYTLVYSFFAIQSQVDPLPLMQASNGKIYGMTSHNGVNNTGSIYELDIVSNTCTILYDFSSSWANPFGWNPVGVLTELNGKLYGFSYVGSNTGHGAMFEFDPLTNGMLSRGDNGSYVSGYSTLASNGKLYFGTELFLYEYDPMLEQQINLTDIYSLNTANASGKLVEYSGNLYGTTLGTANNVLLEYNINLNSVSSKYVFNNNLNGVSPCGSLLISNNKLIGLTAGGGSGTYGTLFKFDLSTNSLLTEINFNSCPKGSKPQGSLLYASNQKIYGMTSEGGAYNKGTLFEYDVWTNSLTTKISFNGFNGQNPYSSLIEPLNGKLYGLTDSGGINNLGVIFEFDLSSGILSKKHDFNGLDGANPFGSLLKASNGKLYGLTNKGGSAQNGVLFEFDYVSNIFTKKVDLISDVNPFGNLIQASNGYLYGMTSGGMGSQFNLGSIFEYNLSLGVFSNKKTFTYAGKLDGTSPSGSLIELSNGILYGLTSNWGANIGGTIFTFNPSNNTYVKKHDFNFSTRPRGSLLKSSNGKLYGLTGYYPGSLFEFDTSGVFTTKVNFTGINGSQPVFTNLIEICLTPAVPLISGTSGICLNATTPGLLNCNFDANTLNYNWTLPIGSSILSGIGTDSILVDFGSLNTGSYTLSCSGNNSCGTGSLSSYTITVGPPNPVIVSSDSSICSGESTTLLCQSGGSYAWSTGETSQTILISPTSNTNYSVNVTFLGGCSSYASFTQNVSECVGVKELYNNHDGFVFYPNPNEGSFILDLDAKTNYAELKIFSSLGEEMKSCKLYSGLNNVKTSLSQGVYYCTIYVNNVCLGSKKIVIQ